MFSSDVELSSEKLLDYYSLRFQIKFNFRDAKQHFGLEDFMNQTKVGVENAVNLSFLMVNVSAKLLKNSEEKCVGSWRPEKSFSRSKIRDGSNKNTSRKP